MTGKQSILGSQQDRVRTDVRLPPRLAQQVGVICETLGIPRNTFYTVAACNYMITLFPLLTAKKRVVMNEELESLIQKILENSRNLP